jgi:hypothetical protein
VGDGQEVLDCHAWVEGGIPYATRMGMLCVACDSSWWWNVRIFLIILTKVYLNHTSSFTILISSPWCVSHELSMKNRTLNTHIMLIMHWSCSIIPIMLIRPATLLYISKMFIYWLINLSGLKNNSKLTWLEILYRQEMVIYWSRCRNTASLYSSCLFQ